MKLFFPLFASIFFFLKEIYQYEIPKSKAVALNNNQFNANCTCNVKTLTCDLYCCCDSECDSSLIQSWKKDPNKCLDNVNLGQSPIYNCVANSLLSFYKLRPGMIVTVDDYSKQYCFQSDLLSNSLNYYYNFQVDSSTTNDLNHDNLFNSVATFSSVINKDDTSNQRSYFYGETLLTYSYLSKLKSILPMPDKLSSGFCNTGRGGRFLINEKTRCISKASTTSSTGSCISEGSFSSYSYFRRYIYSNKGSINSPIEITSTNAVEIDTTTNTGYCKNAVRSVKYQIKLDSSLAIKSATVVFDYYITSPITIDSSYPIDFSIEFIGESNSAITSGNQGYLLNSAILFGDDSSNPISSAFYLSDRNFKCLATSNSDESNKNEFKIFFGQNKIYSCSEVMSSTLCSSNSFSNFIQKVKSLAMFGNSQTGNKSSWVTINGTSEVSSQIIGSTCKLPLEIKLEIIISKYKNYTTINNYIAGARVYGQNVQTIKNDDSYIQYFNVIFKWNIPNELQPNYQPISANIANDLFMPFLVTNNAEFQSTIYKPSMIWLVYLLIVIII